MKQFYVAGYAACAAAGLQTFPGDLVEEHELQTDEQKKLVKSGALTEHEPKPSPIELEREALLEQKTKAELEGIASAAGIETGPKARKADLVEAIKEEGSAFRVGMPSVPPVISEDGGA